MSKRALTLALLVGAGACTMKEAAPVDSAASPDSTAAGVAAPVTPVSTGAAIDSVKANPPVAGQKGQTPRDSIIGRDSAYGPIGSIDEKGNVTPIKKQVRK
jgi:hypothetical protein